MGCNTSKVISQQKDTKPETKRVKKHIFFAYVETDESDEVIVEELKNQFVQRRFRIYEPTKTENINEKIAIGIENAAVILVFSSPSLETSKIGAKLLNYADQTKTPMLTINLYETFQPKGWLGAILAPKKACSTNFDEIVAALVSLKIETDNLIRGNNENVESNPREEFLFYGGSKSDNMKASYQYSGDEYPMKFKFFALKNGKVYGEGDDDIGAFTFAGQYTLLYGSGDIEMNKQYIGKHCITYTGKIFFREVTGIIEGYWKIGEMSDIFHINLSLPRTYIPEKKQVITEPIKRKSGSKVLISYCPCQYDLAQKITKGLLSKAIPTICPPLRMHDMIKTAAQDAVVVVPLMSKAYEASTIAKYLLSYVDEVGIPIVPVKTQDRYTQSGWLGVICAGSLWIRMTNASDFDKKLDDLATQLNLYINNFSNDEQSVDILVDEACPQGYYIQCGQQFDMTFNMFTLVNGCIAGEGQDYVGDFVIHGTYNRSHNPRDFDFQFKKHYIGQHDVQYSGTITKHGSQLFFDGQWVISSFSDDFHLEVLCNSTPKDKTLHVMLSYQWNNQALVKQIASMFKEMNVPIWFDIAGDMKGNINSAMADGVEGAAAIVCFITVPYMNSINCQKEFTYAHQLKKTIVPVLLEDEYKLQDTWLGMMINPLKKIDMRNETEINSSFTKLMQCIKSALEQNSSTNSNNPQVITRFEGSTVKGKYYQFGRGFDMVFDFFSLREGRVSGQGTDTIGAFTMAGTYDNEGKTNFVKQYIGQHAVEYEGDLVCDSLGGFKIHGNWRIGWQSDNFSLESA